MTNVQPLCLVKWLLLSLPALAIWLSETQSAPQRLNKRSGDREEQQRLLYGFRVTQKNLPFTAALYFSDLKFPFCSGTIMTTWFVLTTANCMQSSPRERISAPFVRTPTRRKEALPTGTYNDSYEQIFVVVGTAFIIDPRQSFAKISKHVRSATHQVDRVYMPNGDDIRYLLDNETIVETNVLYETIMRGYVLNMALLKLKTEMEFNTVISSIPIFSSSVEKSQLLWYKRISEESSMRGLRLPPCIVSGYGFDPASTEPDRPLNVRYSRMMHVDYTLCRAGLCGNNSMKQLFNMIPTIDTCFKSLYPGDTCPGDEGAPIYCAWFRRSVVGIVSKSAACGHYGMPTIVQKIWAGYWFLKRIMKDEFEVPMVDTFEDPEFGIRVPL